MVDLYVTNARAVSDDAPLEVAITAGKIVAIGRQLVGITAKQTLDAAGQYLSAGWIDDHTHCYDQLALYYDDPDEVGVKTGVTTVIDAGSTGADNIADFYQRTRTKKTNVYALINIAKTGILAQDELGDMQRVQWAPLASAVTTYPAFIVGIKARESHSVVMDNGVEPLVQAKAFQAKLSRSLPVMVHIGANPPELDAVLALMTSGDVLTHAYNGKPNGILTPSGLVKAEVFEAYHRGVRFDVGHGTDSYNFKTGRLATQAGLRPWSISTDIYHRNREQGPVYNLATTLEKMLLLNYSLPEVIRMITAAPADSFHLTTKGRLEVGLDGDLTLFTVTDGAQPLTDADGNTQMSTQLIQPTYAVVGGHVYEVEAGLK